VLEHYSCEFLCTHGGFIDNRSIFGEFFSGIE